MSVVDGSPREHIGEVTDLIFETIARPIRGASLFYALYYLLEIEGYQEAAFDYQRIRAEYWRGFYWYGVFSIAQEASHVNDRYLVHGYTTDQYLREQQVEQPIGPDATRVIQLRPDEIGGHFESLVDPAQVPSDPEDVAELLVAFAFESGELRRALFGASSKSGADRAAVSALFGQLHRLSPSLLEDPRPLILAINQFFEHSTTQTRYIGDHPTPPGFTDAEFDRLGTNGKAMALEASGWLNNQWNGHGWTGITRQLLRRPALSETAWVDQCWSIEHNNSNWMDKVALRDSEREAVRAVLAPDDRFAVADVLVFNALEELLDAVRVGELGLVFDYAVQFSDDVTINLRRARTVFGL